MKRAVVAVAALVMSAWGALMYGQHDGAVSPDHPAIQYATRATTDAIAMLNRRLASGETVLKFDRGAGYLRSVLAALRIPVESQMLVYSETSLQSDQITKERPRALYFGDDVSVGWVRGAETLELSAVDPQQGPIFYQLNQTVSGPPRFTRSRRCLECHLSNDTANVPGWLTMSMLPLSDDPNEYAVGWAVDHRTPIPDRWGGWYVTGTAVPPTHLGNVRVYGVKKGGVRARQAPKLTNVAAAIDASTYPALHSDVVALMVFNHQTRMTNLLTRMNWLARTVAHGRRASNATTRGAAAGSSSAMHELATEVVDYLLFVDEAPLTAAVQGSSGFAEKFSAVGPRDGKGRSLRDFDLRRRLFRYPCSYLIYGAAFDALPAAAKELIYQRMWTILSGEETAPDYRKLSLADRQAIVEILIATKKDLPAYFRQPVTR